MADGAGRRGERRGGRTRWGRPGGKDEVGRRGVGERMAEGGGMTAKLVRARRAADASAVRCGAGGPLTVYCISIGQWPPPDRHARLVRCNTRPHPGRILGFRIRT